MAFRFCDGMDCYASVSDVPAKGWVQTGTYGNFSATAGAFGGGAIGFNNNENNAKWVRAGTYPYSAGMTLCAGFWMKQSNAPSALAGGVSSGGIFGLDAYTVLTVDPAGHLNWYPFGVASAGGTGTHNVCDNNWHWVEIAILMATTAIGTVQVYVDGVIDINLSSVTTIFSSSLLPSGGVYIGTGSNNAGYFCVNTFDDLIVWDLSGSTFNTFPLGPRRIGTVFPTGAGASTQFTPLTSPNWSAVNGAYSSTANYVYDTSSGNVDLYTQGGLTYTPLATINAVVVNSYAQDPARSGARHGVNKLRSGATPAVASGATNTLSVATNYQDCFVTDSSSTAWTTTTVGSMQIGVGD